jgi:hypothetical protein
MGGLEAVVTGIFDEFKWIQKYKYGREVLTFVVVYSASLMSIVSTTRGGVYALTLLGKMKFHGRMERGDHGLP